MAGKTADVLIVGAGPTGLTLAIELKRRNIPCRLIEKRVGPKNTSRSFTIHARTMEMFDKIGLSDVFLRDGIINKGFNFNFKSKDVRPTLDFTALEAPHPYIVICSQNETEERLLHHLNENYSLVPELSTELVDLKIEDRRPTVTVRSITDGSEEIVKPNWVVGCDGVRSFVREAAGLGFAGSDYSGMVLQMMDVKYEGFKGEDDWIHYYISKDNFLLIAKLPGDDHRVLVSDMRDGADPSLSQRQVFQDVVDGHVQDTKIGEPTWATKWTIWKRLAQSYSKGNVFLAGDAAHVHSPAGGQGMNVGMQDAFNLAWKLALVIKGQAKRELLDTYELERKPVGAQVIAGTDAMHDIIMAHGKGIKDRLALTQAPGWHEEAINRISGLSYHYRECVKIPDALAIADGPLPGDRVPDVDMGESGRLFDLLKHPNLTLLLIPGTNTTTDDIEWARSEFVSCFPDIIQVQVVENETESVRDRYGIHEDGQACLIRPDGYLTLRCKLEDIDQAVDFLGTWFHKTGK